MTLEIIAGYLVFDGVMAGLFWWMTANEFRGVDAQPTEVETRRDPDVDDWFYAGELSGEQSRA